MSVSRVKVGQPLDVPRTRLSGAVKWSPSPRPRREAPPRMRLSRPGGAPRPAAVEPILTPQAPPDLNAAPLAFLSPRLFIFLIGLAFLVVALTWGMVNSNHRAVNHSYEISALTQEKMKVLEINRRLKTELAQYSSLNQLEMDARQKLGLVTPQQGQIVVID